MGKIDWWNERPQLERKIVNGICVFILSLIFLFLVALPLVLREAEHFLDAKYIREFLDSPLVCEQNPKTCYASAHRFSGLKPLK